MEVTRFADGLWRWSTRYEEWGDTVGSVYYEAPDAIVLIDPLVPADASEAMRFWKALDRDVARLARPVHVYVTVFWHVRSAGEIVRRYNGTLQVPSRARAANEKRAGVSASIFRPLDPLPGGLEALATGRATEVVYWLPAHRALVPGDVLLGDDDGGLRLCPSSWLPASVTHAKLRSTLKPLLDLPVERVLVSHGDPVIDAAPERLREAIAGR